jgi:hypothetical protein
MNFGISESAYRQTAGAIDVTATIRATLCKEIDVSTEAAK